MGGSRLWQACIPALRLAGVEGSGVRHCPTNWLHKNCVFTHGAAPYVFVEKMGFRVSSLLFPINANAESQLADETTGWGPVGTPAG